ncbi:T9SS type B sorting domain-containing protein [Flavobacterium sp. SM15]|uniref:T9SS type B sorting domain-containing protein n=1 Tax=Flavobacterium sp. SM15 TaxID=2908005 RepID=UPI001EDA1EF2|nr:choice-of-anchor L domain-containing protein [Flavobacterium sp. SM15]MCG2611068.1 T9SS type B sorting domain-containing protein [Flavobacterium sp. SM15]
MREYKKGFGLLVLVLLSTITRAQVIQIDQNYTAQQLVENVLINSGCAQASSFSVSGGNFSDGSKSYAYFSNTSPSFPFAEGIILSTGKALSAQGPNSYISDDGGGMGWGGDSDLNQALGVSNTTNRTILEFDFVPLSDKISFDYIFASEEYHDNAQCTYSDGFAFLLKKVGTSSYQNLAVIPGTNIPVKVTSVHPQVPGGCAAQNEAYFGSYNSSNHPTNFNGQTVVLTAQSTVEPGETYHIKLVIADEGNFRYDSAIFLKAGSFNIGPDLGADRTLSGGNPLCPSENLVLNGTLTGATSYKWYRNNVAISGATNPTYSVSQSGTYKVEVTINGTCTTTGEITLEYAPLTANNTQLTQCDDNSDGITTYNLTNAQQAITGGTPGVTIQGYYHTLLDAQNQINSIGNFQNYQNTTPNESIIVKVKNQYNCLAYATVTLQIPNHSIAPVRFEKCDSDTVQNGSTEFTTANFTSITNQLLTGQPVGLSVVFFTSAQNAVLQNNPISVPFTNTVPDQQVIYARISNVGECYSIVAVTLIVHSFNPVNFHDEIVPICDGNPVVLDAGSGFTSYLWNTTPTQNSQTITVSTSGTYTVTVTNSLGCQATKKFTIETSLPPTITSIETQSFMGQNNSITVHVFPLGNYQYSLDNIIFQNSNVFTPLNPGEYNVYVKNLCGDDNQTVYILDYPHFFTPNNDSYNDTWFIKNLESEYPNSQVRIFDRYGKLLKQMTATDTYGWNGLYLNNQLPADDYWFVLTLENGQIIKGHFALLR